MPRPNKEPGSERKKFFSDLSLWLTDDDLEKVQAAYEFSKYGHRGQTRDNGSRYFNHPRSVAKVIFSEVKIYDWRVLVTALLHDIIEDSYLLSEKRIRINFGKRVAKWVKYLTKQDGVDYAARLKSCGIWQVLLIKLADRLHNLRELGNCTPTKQRKQLEETRRDYIPLTEILIELLPSGLKYAGKYLQTEIVALCDKLEAELKTV